ncbi:MAG TPA: DUF2341 domain-containing protein [Methanomicrobiales archaeon]|nr:DUF2341 domain-containing protein [Methanomicrobiales archaeon]
MEVLNGRTRRAGRGTTGAVSEVVGTIILVGMVMVGVVLVGTLLLSGQGPVQVPVFDSIISNQSKTVYIYHKGGDPLYAGTYKILVNGNDSTSSFSIASPGTEPWSVGDTLTATLPYLPVHVAIVFNQSGGGATVLAGQDLVGGATLAPNPNAWYFNPAANNCSWRYRKKITISHGQVAADQVHFPLLVSLTDGDLQAKARPNGSDLVFTSSDGMTILPYEIDNFTSGTGYLAAWVEAPALSSSTDTVLYLYYGNGSAFASGQAPATLWGDAGYVAVWHLSENGTGLPNEYKDSTGNPNGGQGGAGSSAQVPVATNGEIGNGNSFDGSNDHIDVGMDATIANIFASGGTFSAWIYPRGLGGTSEGRVGDKASSNNCGTGCSGWALHLQAPNLLRFRQGFTLSAGNWSTPANSIAMNSWQYVAVTYNSGDLVDPPAIYLNGASQVVTVNSTPVGGSVPSTDVARKMRIGAYQGGTGRGFNGVIDEVRVSKLIRSASWIATEYANQASPSTFYSVGGEETWWKC